MTLTRGLLIFAYGLFTIAVQTLLFREFVTAFEGNDISVGIFFGTWFLWVGLGAVLVRRWGRVAEALVRHIELLFLAYLPALIAQLLMTVQVRTLAGVASYDLMSVQAMVWWAIVVNAPVSLITGVLFPVACRWVKEAQAFSVARVYILEALGSFAGGLVVTVLLAHHVSTVQVLFLLALILLLSVLAVAVTLLLASAATPGRRDMLGHASSAAIALVLVLLLGGSLVAGVDGVLAGRLRAWKWMSLLPRDAFEGAFHTAQAEYLHGTYRGQWVVVREGSVCEAVPDDEAAGKAAAIALCQNRHARRILVVGSGVALCDRLLALPQVEQVAWAHPDNEYVALVQTFLPDEYRVADERFDAVTGDIRQYLRGQANRFDLVVLNLPDVTSSVFNRYYTLEFYERVKAVLRDGGVLSVSVAGGENVMGPELVRLGASVKTTLERVFSQLVLVPGDESWFLASDSAGLTGDPATLRDRLATIENAESVFPPTGLLSVYRPQRAARALELYEKVDLPQSLLINRDARPLTHLYGLLVAARQSGALLTRFVRLLTLAGIWPFLVPVVVFVALRSWALGTQRRGPDRSSFDSSFLVFSTGWIGIGVMIVLMYMYQTQLGSLYLHVGLISSLFMAGLTVGAVVTVAVSGRTSARLRGPLVGALVAHAGLLVLLAWWRAQGWGGSDAFRASGQTAFAVAFALSGFCGGVYWPIAAAQLRRAGFEPGRAGSRLETADHLGACWGGVVTSLLMVPVLGTGATLFVLVGLLAANVPAACAALARRDRMVASVEMTGLRSVGYVLFGAGACIVVCSNLLSASAARLRPALPQYAVEALAPERSAQEGTAVLADGAQVRYFTVAGPNEPPSGFIFASRDFAPDVRGFGGRIDLAIHADSSGTLLDFLIVRSNETPSYFELLDEWLATLKGRDLFAARPFAGIDAVTGATVSSEAVLAALKKSSARFASEVLGRRAGAVGSLARQDEGWARLVPDVAALYLLGAFAAALVVTLWGGFRTRLVVLIVTFLAGGVFLNAQYSSEQMVTLLSAQAPALSLSGALLLTVGVPVFVLLFGNLYCGYVCPFGAAQELLGYIVPRRWRPLPSRQEMRVGRFVKYALLFVLVAAFFVARNRTTLAGDPLISAFSFQPSLESLRATIEAWPGWLPIVLGIVVLGALFFGRFWCRYLCPVGAFLSLLNHAQLLRRWMPAKRFGKCEFGLSAGDHLDCIHCDRCRYPVGGAVRLPKKQAPAAPPAVLSRPFVVVVVTIGLFVAGLSLSRFRVVMPAVMEETVAVTGAGGQPRDVDVQRIRTLIEQGRLSDKEALYYKRVGDQRQTDEPVSGENN